MAIHPGTAGGIELGAVIGDTYEVTALIGRGGMGSVWAANHRRLPGKQVAIKVLHTDVASDAESLARFRREAEVASRLGHANIVQVIDFNTLPDGAPYLVLELLRGESLDQRLARGPMPLSEVTSLVRQIGSGLSAAHRQQVIHRDLKPQNIFLVPTEMGGDLDTQAKILDFGISKIRGSQTIKTQESTILGTPQYMAPEQATGAHADVDQTTDIFALGAIVYEMLCGRPAFGGQSVPEVVFKVVYEQPKPLAELVPELPGDVVAAIERALAKKQTDRFPDVGELIEALTGRPLITLRTKTPVPLPTDSPEQVSTAETQAADSGAFDHTLHSGNHEPPSLPMPSAADMVAGNTGAREQRASPAPSEALAKTIATTGSGSVAVPPPPESAPAQAKSRGALIAVIVAALAVLGVGAVLLTRGGGDGEQGANASASRHAASRAERAKTPDDVEPEAAEPGKAEAAIEVPGTAEPEAAEPEQTEPEQTAPEQTAPEQTAPKRIEPEQTAPKRTEPKQTEPKQTEPKQTEPQRIEPDDADAPPPPRLRGATQALADGDVDEAIRLGKQALRGANPKLKQRVYSLLTVAYCKKQDLANARAWFRKIRPRARKRAQRSCLVSGIEL